MALTSTSPQQQPAPTPISPEDDEVGNGLKIPQNSTPGPAPLESTALATLKSGASMTQAMNNVAKSAGSKSGGGGILGTIGSVIGKAIPFIGGLFNQGGMVSYAHGGMAQMNPDNTYGPGQAIEPPPQQPPQGGSTGMSGMNEAIGIGYAIGALHQRDFGGTPETLNQASSMIAKMLGGEQQSQGFAFGGTAQSPTMGAPPPPAPSANPAMQPIQPMQSTPQPVLQAQPNHPIARGYMQNNSMQRPVQGFQRPQPVLGAPAPQPTLGAPPAMAAGGTLQPGQPFMGEGEVRGPGGPTDDAIPAKLSNGEYVMSAPAVAFFGVDKMDKMNEQGKQGFMQSKAQVQANQEGGPPMGMPPGAPQGAPPTGLMQPPPQMSMPMQQAKGGPAVTRTRNSGFMG